MKEQHPSLLDEERNLKYLPGVVGVEPTHGASKVHCLTDLAIPQRKIELMMSPIYFVALITKNDDA